MATVEKRFSGVQKPLYFCCNGVVTLLLRIGNAIVNRSAMLVQSGFTVGWLR